MPKTVLFTSLAFFLLAFFLPSRLASSFTDVSELIFYAKNGQIGLPYLILLLYPIGLILYFINKSNYALAISVIIIICFSDLFYYAYVFLDSSLSPFRYFLKKIIPLLVFTIGSIYLLILALKRTSNKFYILFLSFVVVFLLKTNDSNCMIEFEADMGFLTYNPLIWLENCAMYYSWWLSFLLFNIACFIKATNTT